MYSVHPTVSPFSHTIPFHTICLGIPFWSSKLSFIIFLFLASSGLIFLQQPEGNVPKHGGCSIPSHVIAGAGIKGLFYMEKGFLLVEKMLRRKLSGIVWFYLFWLFFSV